MPPLYPARYLDSIYWRTTDLHDHFTGRRVFIAGNRGFYGAWFTATFEDWRARGVDVTVEGASRRDGFDVIRTRTYPETLRTADWVINCAGSYQGLTDVELNLVHGQAPGWLRQSMKDGATLLHVSSGAAGNPLTPYARSKLAGEKVLATLSGPTQIVRPFATVGPGMGLDKDFAISRFIDRKLAGQPLEIPEREVVRSFVYIADLVVQCLHVMVHGDGRPYEVGSNDELTIEEAARLISHDVRVVDKSYPTNAGVDQYVADLTRIRSHFNVDLDWDSREAVLDTLAYYTSGRPDSPS